MNLNSYDSVNITFEKGTWVDPTYLNLYSTEIEYFPNCYFFKRYNKETNEYKYFIVLLNNSLKNNKRIDCTKWKQNVIKIDISSIWKQTSLKNIIEKSFIQIKLVEEDEDGKIYQIYV